MHLNLLDSEKFLINLVLQRTAPLGILNCKYATAKWRKDGDLSEIKKLIKNKSFLKNYLSLLLGSLKKEINELEKFCFGETINSLVSIGPGNGLLELLFIKKYIIKKILLVDIESSETHDYGFRENSSGYALLDETKKFFINNHINEKSIFLCNPNLKKIPNFSFDMLISTCSMGFHYPCNSYFEFIINNSNKGSIIILDIKRGVSDKGLEMIKESFKLINSINYKISDRIKLKKIN